jgi:hypothetical protein
MAIFPGLGNEGVLASFVVDADTRVKTQIRELLGRLRKVGRIARNARPAGREQRDLRRFQPAFCGVSHAR